MRSLLLCSALLTLPTAALATCRTDLAAGASALARFEVEEAEAAFRRAEKQCATQESALRLAGLLYDRSLKVDEPLRQPLLREARRLVRTARSRGETSCGLLTIRAAIGGELAQLSDSSSEQARLLLSVHRDATRARALDPDNAMPLVVLGAWHRNAAALGFKERLYIRMVAGSLPDASLEQSRRLLEQAVAQDSNPVTLYFLGATQHAQGERNAARETFDRCARAEPASLRESFIQDWCQERMASR